MSIATIALDGPAVTVPMSGSVAADLDVHRTYNEDTGEIADATARTIAAWWMNPRSTNITRLAQGVAYDTSDLIAEVSKVRPTGSKFDHIALDCLCTWAINRREGK
jgi:hypothetical protein